MTDLSRTCAYLPCSGIFYPKRSDARYCSAPCRSADRRRRQSEGYDPRMAERLWEGYRSVRRRSRIGLTSG